MKLESLLTNPIYFCNSQHVHDWLEPLQYEEHGNCVQHWYINDLITLQFVFSESMSKNNTITLHCNVDGVDYIVANIDYQNEEATDIVNNLPHCRYPRCYGIKGVFSGVFVFQKKLSDIIALNTNSAIFTANHCFYFRVVLTDNDNGKTLELRSQTMRCINSLDIQYKLIEYKWKGVKFNTNWDNVPLHYMLRVPATFYHRQIENELAIFQNYNGDNELINAHVTDTIPFIIGSPNGLNDYYLKLLYYIFSCETIKINNNYYVPAAPMSVERVQGYANFYANVNLCYKDFQWSDSTSVENESNKDIGVVIPLDDDSTTEIVIDFDRDWYIVNGDKVITDVNCGFGKSTVAVNLKDNRTQSDITETIRVYDSLTNELIGTAQYTIHSNPIGIGVDIINQSNVVINKLNK